MTKTLQSLTFYDFVSLPLKIYSVAGIKLFQWNDEDLMNLKEKIFLVALMINLFLNFWAKSLYCVFDDFHSTVHMTQWFLYYIFANNGFFKMITVALGRKKLHYTIKQLERLFPRTYKERQEFELLEGYRRMMRHCRIMANMHWIIAVMFIAFPLLQSIIGYYWQSDAENRVFYGHLPYIMTYPFDETRGLGYAIAYIGQFVGGYTVSCYFVGSDMLLMCTIYTVILQYKYLCKRICKFKSRDFTRDMAELKDMLETHCLLNDLAQSVNDVFSKSILLNYMISTFVIVLLGIQITSGASDALELVKFVGFFTSATVQVFYICLFGTNLMETSSLVSESFFSQEWYMTDVRYQRMLVLAIARSQRPSYLTAFKFFIISMESFSNLMTNSYQFFTLLKTRMEEQL